jgi:hypothetical protein
MQRVFPLQSQGAGERILIKAKTMYLGCTKIIFIKQLSLNLGANNGFSALFGNRKFNAVLVIHPNRRCFLSSHFPSS